MTDNEINIAIAECCGWKDFGMGWWLGPRGEEVVHLPDSSGLPDYCNDLNAMSQAEQTLDEHEQPMYYAEIYKQSQDHEVTKCASFDLVTVSAHQRAEAFLRVKGLWKEAK